MTKHTQIEIQARIIGPDGNISFVSLQSYDLVQDTDDEERVGAAIAGVIHALSWGEWQPDNILVGIMRELDRTHDAFRDLANAYMRWSGAHFFDDAVKVVVDEKLLTEEGVTDESLIEKGQKG